MIGRRSRLVAAATGAVLAAAGVAVAIPHGPPQHSLIADFTSTVGLYPGAHVQVLGVDVGTVNSVSVKGDHVEVRIAYDADHPLPADVHAEIVSPSIVGDRAVALVPAYSGGPTLHDHAHLGEDRTAVPVELDQTYRTLDQLATALGPQGANANGALSRLLSATAHHLSGNGRQVNATLHDLAQAADALANSRDEIAGTIGNLSRISGTLSADDPQIRELAGNLAAVSTELNGQRDDLRNATSSLSQALGQIGQFVKDNKRSLTTDIAGLTQTTATLAAHQRDLAEILDVAPLGLSNLANVYMPENFDPAHPDAVAPQARTMATVARSDAFTDLATQLGFTMTALCGSLPPTEQQQLAPLCTALRQSGGQLGQVFSNLIGPDHGGLVLDPPATSLPALLPGGPR